MTDDDFEIIEETSDAEHRYRETTTPGQRMLDRALRRLIGKVIEHACRQGKSLCAFTVKFLESGAFDECLADPGLYCQSFAYIHEVLDDEYFKLSEIPDSEDAPADADAGYWLGYLLAEWQQLEGITGRDVSPEDIEWLYGCYGIMSTVSIPVAIDKLKEARKYDMAG